MAAAASASNFLSEPNMNSLMINGTRVQTDFPPDTPLLWFVRDQLNLTGTKFGCGVAACGACTVHVDGEATRSCSVPISTVDKGQEILTIEGIKGKVVNALRDAWTEHDVVQCGYCQSGQIMSAAALLSKNKRPTDKDIDEAMNGNLCRCATYVRIRTAIKTAAKKLA
jgi:isoquinoline 1-oxidoreductase subunit alpha